MRRFKLTEFAVDNKITIYFLIFVVVVGGIWSYFTLPKEKFPEVAFPFYSVVTIYPGTSPSDIENLVTRPIENQLKSIKGIKNVQSSSIQDVSSIFIEFETDVNEIIADKDVKNAVDKAKPDLPTDLDKDPEVTKIEITDIPILNINLSGDLGVVKLKEIADNLEDVVEGISGVSRVDVIGGLTREIKINVDLYKMQSAGISFDEITNAVKFENMTMSGGMVDMDAMKRNMRIIGEFKNPNEVQEIQIKKGIYVKDIAEVIDGFKDVESYARLKGEDVITLNVIKKTGSNLIKVNNEIKKILEKEKKKLPNNLKITLSGDTSIETNNSVDELFNTVIIGFLVVVLVLMFFMGIKNSLFVGISVPMSMLVSFMILPSLGYSLNMVVLMSYILVLGIVVDDAIVVVENIYRHFKHSKGEKSIPTLIKEAAAEVAIPVLFGTITTIVPFFTLLFWGGIMGEFMKYIPVTFIITILSSMVIAYVLNPVFATSFMNKVEVEYTPINFKKVIRFTSVCLCGFILFKLLKIDIISNFFLIGGIIYLLFKFIFDKAIIYWHDNIIPKINSTYERTIGYILSGKRPYYLIGFAVFIMFFSVILFGARSPKVNLFPVGDPNQIFVYITMPSGSSINSTNETTKKVEEIVFNVVGKNNPDVEYVISNVAVNAGKSIFDRTSQEKLSKVTVGFVEYKERKDKHTKEYLTIIRDAVKNVPAAKIIVEQEESGPPAGAPINIEISGDEFETLVKIENDIKNLIKKSDVKGIEKLESNLIIDNPEITIKIDRQKANKLGISTAAISRSLRTALYGEEVSKFKEDEKEYEINLRLEKKYRDNLQSLFNITLLVPGKDDKINKIPLSAVAEVQYTSSYGSIIRKDYKRTATLASNVLDGYNANEIIAELKQLFKSYELPTNYEIKFTGQQEEQEESGSFLFGSLLLTIGLILTVLVFKFNSIPKTLIIIMQVFLSIFGVLLGYGITGMELSVILTGTGIITVIGVVIKNGIILIDYADQLVEQKGGNFRNLVITAGRTRLTPVLLTATATIVGLLPLAIGFNFDFITLFSELNPHIFWGGDSATFWKPLAWTIIFGLTFATFLTLILVPTIYYLVYRKKYADEDGNVIMIKENV